MGSLKINQVVDLRANGEKHKHAGFKPVSVMCKRINSYISPHFLYCFSQLKLHFLVYFSEYRLSEDANPDRAMLVGFELLLARVECYQLLELLDKDQPGPQVRSEIIQQCFAILQSS